MCTYNIRRQWVLQCALTQCARGKYCQQGMGGTQMHSRSLTLNQLEAELWENTDCSCITSAVTCCFIRRSWMSSTVHSKDVLKAKVCKRSWLLWIHFGSPSVTGVPPAAKRAATSPSRQQWNSCSLNGSRFCYRMETQWTKYHYTNCILRGSPCKVFDSKIINYEL